MDEADALGDRICILHHGKKKIAGSPLYIKQKFGVGYSATLTKQHKDVPSAPLTDVMRKHVPELQKLSDVGTELTFQLPLKASDRFSALLTELDARKAELGLATYGLSVTTLESVFIRVATNKDKDDNKRLISQLSQNRYDSTKSKDGKDAADGKSSAAAGAAAPAEEEKKSLVLSEGRGDVHRASIHFSAANAHSDAEYLNASAQHQGFCRHFAALFCKRFHIAKRDQRGLCCTLLVRGADLYTHVPPIAC
jgi:ABC-type multidrug transport system ATPase subunit